MKNLLHVFCCLSLFCSTIVFAQSNGYYPMLDPSNEWNITYFGCGSWTECFTLGNDTTFNGINYKTNLWGTFLREDVPNKRVYIYNPYEDVEYLSFDFGLQVGQSYFYTEYTNTYEGVVTNRDLVQMLDGTWRTRIILDITHTISGIGSWETYPVTWIEGIGLIGGEPFGGWGSGAGFINCHHNKGNLTWIRDEIQPVSELECSCPQPTETITSFMDNEVINTLLPNIVVYPNPVREQLYIDLPTNDNIQVEITDLSGKKKAVFHPQSSLQIPTDKWPQGIYIVTIAINNQIVINKKIIK